MEEKERTNIIIINYKLRKKNYSKLKQNKQNVKYISIRDIIFKFALFLLVFFFSINSEIIKNSFMKEEIIISRKYDAFEKTKSKYIKDPILKPYIEQIKILNHVYTNNTSAKLKKSNIHICMGLNEKYIYPTLVSIESVLENCNKVNTFITYHILCSPNIRNKDLNILQSLMIKYSSNLEMIFYNMGNNFNNRNNEMYSQTTYYRLLLPIIVDIDRILYLDGDTLIYKDLDEMYHIDFNDNYVFGVLDYYYNGIDYLGINSKIYINAGVILINLDKIRKNKKIYEIIKIVNSNMFLHAHDQTLINYAFYPNIGIIPSKYAIFNFYDEKDIDIYLSIIRTKLNKNDLVKGLKDPTIVHHVLCLPKLWSIKNNYLAFSSCHKRKCICKKYHKLWHNFAKNTYYYDEILKFTGKK